MKRGHEWQAAINHRNRKIGCPYCHGRYATPENCLSLINPVLAAEWHPKINGILTPRDIEPKSSKKVWWQCHKGHEWESSVSNRSRGNGCPYCSNQAVCDDNCLQTLNPSLAKEWHPNKNDDLRPNDVTVGSRKKVWWICEKRHEWQAVISGQTVELAVRIVPIIWYLKKIV